MNHLEDVQPQDQQVQDLQDPDPAAQDHRAPDHQASALQALGRLHSTAAHHQGLDEAARLKRKSRHAAPYLWLR